MARNTTTELTTVFDTTLTTAQLQAFLDMADTVVSALATAATTAGLDPALSTTELKHIEVFLAAHFSSLMDPRELRYKVGDAEAWHYPVSATTAWGRGLALTPYGQQAVVLDRSGYLAKLGQRKGSYRASPREDSDSYTERLTKS